MFVEIKSCIKDKSEIFNDEIVSILLLLKVMQRELSSLVLFEKLGS